MKKDRSSDPHRELLLLRIGGCVLTAGICTALGWVWTHPTPFVELPMPPSVYWVPVPPIHAPQVLIATMGAAFGAVVAGRLDIAYPLMRQAARRFRWLGQAPHHWAWGIFAPALRQSTMGSATLTAGVIGISLWHYGRDGLDCLDAAIPTLWGLGVMLPAFGLLVSIQKAWRLGLSAAFYLFQFQIAIAVARWALNSI